VLAAVGVPLVSAEEDRARRGDLLRPRTDEAGGPDGSSTYQSLARGDSTEVDFLAGEIVLQARLAGVPAPVNALLQATVHDVVRRGAGARSVDAATLLEQLE
jgi:2-dehydropantoate 2-reductase